MNSGSDFKGKWVSNFGPLVLELVHGKRLRFAAVLALLLSTSWAYGQDRLPNCYVMSAGVDNYLKISKLRGDLADARYVAGAFKGQEGKLYNKVHERLLLDQGVTRGSMIKTMQSFAAQGNPGDHVVFFMSGHGSTNKRTLRWEYCPWDFDPRNPAGTNITDKDLFDAAEPNLKRGKIVFIIIDACFCGQVELNAKATFARYKNPKGGGLIVMSSSHAKQLSHALGQYSAFAKAYADSIAGGADRDGDGKITLDEVRKYSPGRVYELLRMRRIKASQDSNIAWSPSISPDMVLAHTTPATKFAGELTDQDPRDTVKKDSYRKSYKHKLTPGRTYQIEMKSDNVDSFLRLESPAGQQVASDDNSGGNQNARILYQPTQAGVYKIHATTAMGDSTGAFTVMIRELTIPVHVAAEPKVPAGKFLVQAAGALTSQTPRDRVRMGSYGKVYVQKFEKNHTYVIDMISTEFDSYLRLENPGGVQVAFDDDGGGYPNARITYRATESGDFKICATSFAGGATGKFLLLVRDLNSANVAAGALKLQNGRTAVNANIDATAPRFKGKRHVAFTINLQQGNTYQMDQTSPIFDSYLILVGPDGNIVIENDDGGGYPSARIVYRAGRSGVYRLIATSYGGSSVGDFTLSVSER